MRRRASASSSSASRGFRSARRGSHGGGCGHRTPGVPPYRPEDFGRGARREPGLRDRSADARTGRGGAARGDGAGRPGRHRDRRRQHLPGRRGERRRHGPGDGRLHGHARDGHQRPRPPGCAREGGPADARALRHRDARGGRAVHPATRDPAPREGARRDLRGRYRQPLLHDRHRGRAARGRDRRRRDHEGHEGRRHLLGRPEEGCDGTLPATRHLHRRAQSAVASDGYDGHLALHGERAADRRLRSDPAREHPTHRPGRAGRLDRVLRRRLTAMQTVLKDVEARMTVALDTLGREFATVRTGRASAGLLDGIRVDYYGTPTPVNQMASVSVPDARTLVIQPWEAAQLKAIEKAIMTSDLGLTPQNDGKVIRLAMPSPTEERRKQLAKTVHKLPEDSRIAIRNLRREANDRLKAMAKDKKVSEDEERRSHDQIQKTTDRFIAKVDELLKKKEQEILSF